MEMEDIETKPKRVRQNPRRKWTVLEEKRLIEFLMENREFEKPTAQLYYRRFAEEKNIRVEWKLTRSKVRNMRTVYSKAKAWEESTGAASMEEEAVKSTLLKMCNFYYAFENIFGSRFVNSAVKEEKFESPECCPIFNHTEFDEGEITMTSECSTAETNEGAACPSRGVTYFQTTVSDIMQIQAETLKLKKKKMDMDLALKERELRIKERELELKERELCSQEKLKILELEMKERLAMEELNRKYK